MHRRRFLTASLGAGVLARAQSPGKRPNVLFLFTDDQRFDTIRALGNPEIRTPNLDRLVRRGTAFTQTHIMGGTIGAVCAPSRGMLLTGQSLFHVHDNLIAKDARRRPFTVFPEIFRNAGYATFGTGKWHNGEKLYARCFTHGENIFFGGMSDHLKVPVADFDPSGSYPKEQRAAEKTFSSELFSDSAIRFLKEQKHGRPFLAYVSYTAPHDPRMAPQRYAEMYSPSKITLPKNFMPEHPFDNGEMKIRDERLAPWPRTPQVVRDHIAAYYAMITHVDAQIGRVLDALEQSGEAGSTIVVFAADNGLAVGQHGLLGKQNLYDHSVRVPLVISGPGIPQGRRIDSLCYLHDVYPTLCELAGLATPDSVESKSLAPLIRNERASAYDSVFFAYRHMQRGVRAGRYKLILYNVSGKQTTQLFDLENDPWELQNLAEERAQTIRLKELRALLREWMKKTDDPLDLDRPNWGYAGK